MEGTQNPPGSMGQWFLLEGGGFIQRPDSASTLVTGLSQGLNVFVWQFTNQGNTTSDTVRIKFEVLSARAGVDLAFCTTETNMQAEPVLFGRGVWRLLQGQALIADSSSPTTLVTQLGTGRNIFSWTVSNGGICPTERDTVTILNYGFVFAEAGIDQAVCGDTARLTGNRTAFSNGFWTSLSAGPLFSSPDSAECKVSRLFPGYNLLVYTLQIGNCAISSDTISVYAASPLFSAFAGLDQTICQTATMLNANRPTFGNGNWQVLLGTGLVASPSSPQTIVNQLSLGVNRLVYTLENPPCPNSTDTLEIEVLRLDEPWQVTADTIVCSSEMPIQVLNVGSSGGSWEVLRGSGEVETITSTNTRVSNLSLGLNILRFTENASGACQPRMAQMLITRQAPASPAETLGQVSICAEKGRLQATQPASGTGKWVVVSGDITVENPSSPSSNFTISSDEAQLNWTVEQAPCPNQTAMVTVRSNRSAPQAFAGHDVGVCGSSTLLEGNPTSGLMGNWSIVSGNGVILNPSSPNTRVEALAIGKNVFRWHIHSSQCPDNFADVVINRFEPPEAPFAGNDSSICTSTLQMQAQTPRRGYGYWELVSGLAIIENPLLPNTRVSNIGPGPHEFAWRVKHGPCPVVSDFVTVRNNNIANLAATGNDMHICNDTVVLTGNFPLNGNGVWTRITGTGQIANPFLNRAIVRNLNIGENRFRWSISVPDCPVTSAEQRIWVLEPPDMAFAGVDTTICGNAILLTGNEPAVGQPHWQLISGAGLVLKPNQSSSWVTGLPPGLHRFEYSISNEACGQLADTIAVEVSAGQGMVFAGENQLICEPKTHLQASWPAVGTAKWINLDRIAVLADSSDPRTTVSQLPAGLSRFLWLSSTGTCSFGDVVSIVNHAPEFSLGNDTFLCAGTAINLQVPSGFSNPVWSTGETTRSISVQRSGQYWAKALSPENCWVTDTLYALFGECQTTLKQPDSKSSIEKCIVYPNPVEGNLFIQLTGNYEPQQAFLFDLNGQKTRVQVKPFNTTTWQIQVSNLRPGMYQLLVLAGNQSHVVRFLKK